MSTELAQYIAHRNAFRRVFKEPELHQSDPDDLLILKGHLESDLSPENLSCDGELRGAALNEKRNRLRRILRDVEIKLVFPATA